MFLSHASGGGVGKISSRCVRASAACARLATPGTRRESHHGKFSTRLLESRTEIFARGAANFAQTMRDAAPMDRKALDVVAGATAGLSTSYKVTVRRTVALGLQKERHNGADSRRRTQETEHSR
jgi:hypothetical protein